MGLEEGREGGLGSSGSAGEAGREDGREDGREVGCSAGEATLCVTPGDGGLCMPASLLEARSSLELEGRVADPGLLPRPLSG